MVQEIVEGVRAIMAGRSGAEQVHSPTNKVLPADAGEFLEWRLAPFGTEYQHREKTRR